MAVKLAPRLFTPRNIQPQARRLHTRRNSSSLTELSTETPTLTPPSSSTCVESLQRSETDIRALRRLSTSSILRSLLLGSLFSHPLLFAPGLSVLQRIASSSSRFLNPDKNPVLRAIIKPLFYDQFCAGTKWEEICKTRESIKSMGFRGVILCYGKEAVSTSGGLHSTGSDVSGQDNEIECWKDGNLKTLDMSGEGDWLGIKRFTGAGIHITNALMECHEPPQRFIDAMDAICSKALSKGCRIWIDAEQQVLQRTIDQWTVDLMRRYNKNGKTLIYNTLQAYLKAARTKLKDMLALAEKEDWTLALKLVRGAYISSDVREKIHDTKQETDESYDGIVRDLLSGKNLGFSSADTVPKVQLFLAGHNPTSVAKALQLVRDLSGRGRLRTVPDFGQLQGMADGLGCTLLQQLEDTERDKALSGSKATTPQVYKCLTWGSIQECMQYLLRRMIENRGGADRMKDGLAVYRKELWRRITWRT